MKTPPPLRPFRHRPTRGRITPRGIAAALTAAAAAGAAVLIGLGCGGGSSVEITPSEAAPGSPSSLQVPDPPAGKAGFDPRTLAALPQGGGDPKARQVPTLSVTLDGSLGLSTSLTPTLAWPDGPSSGVDWKVTNLAGKSVVAEGGRGNTLQVPGGALKGGNAYLWSASAAGRTFGPHMMRVDLQRSDVQGVVDYSGVGVTAVVGEPVIAIGTPAVLSAGGPVAVGLNYQPTNRLSAVASPGLPAGWQMSASSSAPWTVLRRPSKDRIELTDSSGQVVPFREASPGAWAADWGAGQGWPSGQYAVLAQALGAANAPFQITDRTGQVTTFPAPDVGGSSYPSSTWSAKNPTPQSDYDASGRLTRITDPVSGRSVTLAYGGSGSCPDAAGSGFIGAPSGMLCTVTGWDGSATHLFYAQRAGAAVIARVVTDAQAGGQKLAQTDIGYDAAGRPDRIRAPLANAAIASGVLPDGLGAGDAAVLTTIAYDSQGRVAQVTRPAGVLSGGQGTVPERVARTFTYPEAGKIVVAQPGRDQPISAATASPATMLVSETTDAVGRRTSIEWNAATQTTKQVIAPGGMVTRHSYDALGRPAETIGPSADPDASGAPRVSYRYDTRTGSGSTGAPVPIQGLMATYWQGGAFQGTPAGASIGPRIDGGDPSRLELRWPASPVGGGEFSARLEGLVVVPEGGITQITNAVPATQVWVDGIRCQAACPPSLGLAGRKAGSLLQLRIDVRSSPAGRASMGVTWTTPGSPGAVAIPASALRPGLPQASATTVRDQGSAGAVVADLTTQIAFSPSDPQQVISARSASGKVATRAYEAYAPGSGAFGRATGYTSAGKDTTTTDYYGAGESGKTSCPGATANQGGLLASRTTPGGLSITQAYDAAGNVVGQQASGQSATCRTLDSTGRLVRSQTGPVVTTYDAAVQDNPMHARVTVTDGATRTSSSVIDLLGRTVRSTDVWGTVVTTAYDSEDRPVEERTVTAKGQATTTTYAYTADGQVQKVTRDGQVLAEMGYQDSTGRLTGAEYANGSSLSLSYDANGNVSAQALSIGGEDVGNTVSIGPSGRMLRRELTGAGADATWEYSYDRDGRLIKASLSGTAPYGVQPGDWSYELNNASERTRITSPLTPKEGFTYAYAPSGAMTSTSDTRFGNRFDYDAAGRATRAGPLTLAYDPTGAVERISDGTTTESRVLAGGQIIATAITTPQGQKAIRYSSSGLMLTTDGLVDSQMVSLPGGVSAQLPPPPAPGEGGGPAQADPATGTATTGTTTTPAEPATTAAAPEPATTAAAPEPEPEVKNQPAAPLPIWRYADIEGSIAWTSTGDAAPTQTTIYDPDGNRLGDASSLPGLSTDPSRPNLLFQGSATAPLSIPVTQMGARSYVPALGIFLQPDPVPNGSSTAYNYASGDPINSSDSTGQWTEWVGVGLAIVASVAIGAAIGAVTAGLGSGPGIAFAIGLFAGAVTGAAGEVIGQLGAQLVDLWVNGTTPPGINWTAFWTAAGAGAVLGGYTAALKAASAQNSLKAFKGASKPVNKASTLGPKGRYKPSVGTEGDQFGVTTQQQVASPVQQVQQTKLVSDDLLVPGRIPNARKLTSTLNNQVQYDNDMWGVIREQPGLEDLP